MKQLLACLVVTLGMGFSFNSALACDCKTGKKCECSEGTCKCGKKKGEKHDCGKDSKSCDHHNEEKKS